MFAAARRAARWLWAGLMRYLDADGMQKGAAVAFYAAFSIAPLLVMIAGVMVWLMGNDAAQAALLDALNRLIGPRETRTLAELLALRGKAVGNPDQAVVGSWLALATTLVGATGVFIELRGALQAMLGEKDGAFSWRQLVRVRLLAIGVVLGCGFLLSVAMLTQALSLVALRWLATQWPVLAPLLLVAESAWSWLVMSLLFALMYRSLPTTNLPMRHALAGAGVAGALFMVGRYGISLYVATTASQSALGAASSFAALLVWVYWSSQIFLLGAALAVEMGERDALEVSQRAALAPRAPGEARPA